MSITGKESLTDRLLLLWLVNDALKINAIGDTKAHKLGYLSELSMNKDLDKGFNYNFKKLQYGPYSDLLQKDVDWLQEQRLVNSTTYGNGRLFQTSSSGRKLLTDFSGLFARNWIFTQKISEVDKKYAHLNTYQLVEVVHQHPHPDEESITIDDLEIGETILYKLASSRAKVEFDITPEEVATLDVYLDKDTYESVIHAFESAKTKPMLSMDEVF